jgi:predicted NBD/HSP70 family sugar kinase
MENLEKRHSILKLGSNKADILSAINQHAPISRTRLAELFDLSFTAVTHIVNEFIEIGVIKEVGDGHDLKPRGRRASFLQLNEDYGYIIGLEVTDVRVKSALADFAGNIKAVKRIIFENHSKDYLISTIIESIESLVEENNISWERVKGIGIGMHGLVDYENGISLTFPSSEEWANVPLKSIIEERFNIPAKLDARLYVATLAELIYGEGRYNPDFVYFNSGPGNGFNIGLVFSGQILRGKDGFAGQFGHLVLDPKGPRCFCGSRGCLVTLASPLAIEKKAIEAINEGINTSLTSIYKEKGTILFKDIADSALKGDKLSVNLIEEAGRYLGLGFSYVINLFAPPLVVLAGTLNSAGSMLLDTIKREIALHSVPQVYQGIEIKFSSLEEDVAARGAVVLIIREHLKKIAEAS